MEIHMQTLLNYLMKKKEIMKKKMVKMKKLKKMQTMVKLKVINYETNLLVVNIWKECTKFTPVISKFLHTTGYTEKNVQISGGSKRQKIMAVSAILLTANSLTNVLMDEKKLSNSEKKYLQTVQKTLNDPSLFFDPFVKQMDVSKLIQ